VRDYEPRLALDGGIDGFALFNRLIAEARDYLEPGGALLVEIGADQESGKGRAEAFRSDNKATRVTLLTVGSPQHARPAPPSLKRRR